MGTFIWERCDIRRVGGDGVRVRLERDLLVCVNICVVEALGGTWAVGESLKLRKGVHVFV